MIAAIAFALAFVWFVVQTLLKSDWVIDGLKNLARPLRPALLIRFNLSEYKKEFRLLYGLAAVVAIALLASRGLARGIDFQPGTEVAIQADREFDTGQLERAAADYFGRRCSVRRIDAGTLHDGQTATYLFLVPGFVPDSTAESRYSIKVDGLVAHLNSNLPVHFVQKSSVSAGATVTGISMQKFVICACVGAFLLLTWLSRLCGFRVAFAVVAAMLLDAAISLGALSLAAVQLSLPIVSSLLAIVGYSVYDSIVVAAHLRKELENAAGGYTTDIVAATLQKLSRRMILTMASTTLSALGVALFCSGLLQDFGIIMATGSVSGMLSTIAIVVPGAEAAYGEPEAFRRRTAVTA
jgi:preprotein translocase SecF subunit